MEDSDQLQADLEEQLAQQKEALADMNELISAGTDDVELVAMRGALEEGIEQLEAALMEIKRAHLLQQLDSLEQQQAQPSTSSRLAEGESCSFRYTDGCYYAGIVGPRQHSSDADAYSVYFAVPTRQFMLHPVVVPAALVQASAPAAPGAQDLTVGRRLLARQRHWRFFEPAEVIAVNGAQEAATVVFVSNGQQCNLPIGLLALSAVTGDAGDSDSPSGTGGAASDAGSSDTASSASDGDDSDSADSALAEDHCGLGLGDMMGHAREAAEAGPQRDTAHFAEFEAHTRGIASKLMAGMGFRQGAGLGKTGQGRVAPLDLAMQLHKKGLGHGSSSHHQGHHKHGSTHKKRRKRGGEKARRAKHNQQRKAARHAAHDHAHQVEMVTGDTGLFAFMNQALGGGAGGSGGDGGSGAAQGGQQGPPAAGRAKAQAPEDRRGLVGQADLMVKAQERVTQLEQSLARNRSNKQLAAQISAKLQHARGALAAAQGEHARISQAVNKKDDHKKWMKF